MGKPLPEPEESIAKEMIAELPVLVKAWIGHHLNNSLCPILYLLHELKKGKSVSKKCIHDANLAMDHLIKDIEVLVKNREDNKENPGLKFEVNDIEVVYR